MTTEELATLFEAHDGEYIKFDRITTRRSNRPDMHAFLLLDELVPGTKCMVAAAEHDEIWLAVSPEQLAEAATEAIVIELARCGVRYDDDVESLAMFA